MRVPVVLLLVPLVLVACSAATAPAGPSTGTPAAVSMAPTAPAGPTTTATVSASGAASLDPGAGKERTDERGVAQVWVPAGTFLMGTDETDPTGELAPPDWARFELASAKMAVRCSWWSLVAA